MAHNSHIKVYNYVFVTYNIHTIYVYNMSDIVPEVSKYVSFASPLTPLTPSMGGIAEETAGQ